MIELFSVGNEDYSKNGDMVLVPVICDVTAALKNTWSLSLEHPIDVLGRWTYIKEGTRLRVPSFNGSQLFIIEKVNKSDSGIRATAKPVGMEAADDCFIVDIRPTNKTGQEALSMILSPNSKYRGVSNITTLNTAYYVLKNAMEAITGSDNGFLERWGGELLFDNYTIIINDRIGTDNGVSLLYGKNIKTNGMRETISWSDVVTRIIPKAYNGHTLPGNSPWVDSPLINVYPTPKTKVIDYSHIRLATDAQSEEGDEELIICNTLQELYSALTAAANKEFQNGIDKPQINLECNMELIQNSQEYKEFADLEKVSLGDTIYCRHDKLNITNTARVVGMVWDCITESVKSVEIGDVSESFISRVTSAVNSTEKALTKNGAVKAEKVSGVIDGANARIIAQAQSAVTQKEKVIIFEDLNPESPTFGAMALGTTGFMIADKMDQSGADWAWSTFGTGKGFSADYIKAGTLQAIKIEGSTINGGTITGTSINNGNGTFSVSSAGVLKASSAEIKGSITSGSTITGATINNGNGTFMVNQNGHLKASSAEITGTIDSGSTITGSTITGSLISTTGEDNDYNYTSSLKDGTIVFERKGKTTSQYDGVISIKGGALTADFETAATLATVTNVIRVENKTSGEAASLLPGAINARRDANNYVSITPDNIVIYVNGSRVWSAR